MRTYARKGGRGVLASVQMRTGGRGGAYLGFLLPMYCMDGSLSNSSFSEAASEMGEPYSS